MNSHHAARLQSRARRLLWLFTFSTMAVMLMAASSPQCARQNDIPLEPVSSYLPEEGDGSCPSICASIAVDARHAEQDRFTTAIKNCQTPDCRGEEAALHVEIMQEIAMDERLCKSACHNQGGGSGGN